MVSFLRSCRSSRKPPELDKSFAPTKEILQATANAVRAQTSAQRNRFRISQSRDVSLIFAFLYTWQIKP